MVDDEVFQTPIQDFHARVDVTHAIFRRQTSDIQTSSIVRLDFFRSTVYNECCILSYVVLSMTNKVTKCQSLPSLKHVRSLNYEKLMKIPSVYFHPRGLLLACHLCQDFIHHASSDPLLTWWRLVCNVWQCSKWRIWGNAPQDAVLSIVYLSVRPWVMVRLQWRILDRTMVAAGPLAYTVHWEGIIYILLQR